MKTLKIFFPAFCLSLLIASCGLNPQNADIDINNTLPEAKYTVYQEAIRKIGLMGQIFDRPSVNIMSKYISDNTGTSVATNAEIPRDITEMVKSTLNGVGGNITFIPYDPDFLANSVNTGYSEFSEKIIPDVIVSGGITEFDRGLVTKGDSTEIDAEIGDYGLSFEDQNKASLAQVTLDFNMIDFRTLAGIPRVQAVNGIKLHKATKEDSFAFTVKSVTLGAKGTIKKIQGRHAAVRLLVELSMVQLLGRYQALPYWRLVPGGQPDPVVIDKIMADFYNHTDTERVAMVQRLLYLNGFQVPTNGFLDNATEQALQTFADQKGLASASINQDIYVALYESVPIEHATLAKTRSLGDMAQGFDQMEANKSVYIDNSASPAIQTGTISINTDKSQYRIGETMNIRFTVDKPMFVRMLVVNSKGEVSTLFPNVYQTDNYSKPGVVYSIPPASAPFTLDVGAPPGTDHIVAVGSHRPIMADDVRLSQQGELDAATQEKYPINSQINIVIVP
ncbi:MAG: DUF4384 domain-containing protein [Methylococcales bacterium]|nr:DUF4384 domain-containing protein [Methylococcales bacterium]